MTEFNIEAYIKDLSPELQEKARACKNMRELSDFIEENDLELPDEALEMVSGGLFGICGSGEDQDAPKADAQKIEKNFQINGGNFK